MSAGGAPEEGFSRSNRLLRAGQFERVFAEPVRSADGCLLVLGRANDLDGPRLGLAVGRKHLKTAHSRNRVKRIVRERFRKAQSDFGGVDFIVLARAGAGGATNAELHRSAAKHLEAVARKARSRSPS